MKLPKLYKGRYLLNDYLRQSNLVNISGISKYPDRLYISNGIQSGVAYNWKFNDNKDIVVLAQDYDGDIHELEIHPINILDNDVYIASLGQLPYVMLKN